MSGFTLRPYSEYRESGQPWLGRMPTHWEVHRNGRLFAERRETADPTLPILEVSLRTGVRVRNLEKGARKQVMADRSKYQRAHAGDIVYNTMRMWQGAVGVAPVDGLVSPAYVVARPRPAVEPRYYAYLFRTAVYLQQVEIESRGIVPDRNRLYWDAFKRMPSVYPPVEDQHAIADFLDAHGRLGRRFERAKRRLTALLVEQRLRGVLHNISGGASTESKTPRTGVEWLGPIPPTWDVIALRMRYAVDLGKMLDAKHITGEHLRPYLRNVDVQWGRVNTVDLPQMDIESHEAARYTLEPGDLLVCEGGEVGRAAFWEGELEGCAYQKALHRVRVLDPGRDNPRFLYYLLFAAAKIGVFLADGSENTIAHLTREKLRAHRFPFPPREEQDSIVRRLDEEGAAIDRVMDRHLAEIRLMREYSTRIIAASVLGHLDVTNVHSAVAAPLIAEEPDGIEEAAGLDDPEEIMVMADDFVEAES